MGSLSEAQPCPTAATLAGCAHRSKRARSCGSTHETDIVPPRDVRTIKLPPPSRSWEPEGNVMRPR